MLRELIKKFAGRFSETVIVIVAVIVFFTFIMAVLNILFPTGTGIRTLIGDHRLLDTWSGARKKESVISPKSATGTKSQSIADAILAYVENVVKLKRSDEIAWSDAGQGLNLYNRDSVQTMSKSSARIDFDRENYLLMGENSLIVIKSMADAGSPGKKRLVQVMVAGELRGKIVQSAKSPVRIEVATPVATAKIPADKGDKAAETELRILNNNDKSSTITILKGTAEITAHGKTVLMEENQSTTISPGSPSPQPKKPDEVRPLLPADGSVYYYRELPPKVQFTWSAPAEEPEYYFILARDSGFKEIVIEEKLNKPFFSYGNLKSGDYYWRVIGAGTRNAEPSTRVIKVFQDRQPPILEVDFPPASFHSDNFLLKGRTEAGATLFVMGSSVEVGKSGDFEALVNFKNGPNIVLVEAMDKVGNTAYSSQVVNVKLDR